MNNFLNNHIVFRFETQAERQQCMTFLRDSLRIYENVIVRCIELGDTVETSGTLREAMQMRNAFRDGLSKVFYRTSVVK
jgi:hypothetical protein